MRSWTRAAAVLIGLALLPACIGEGNGLQCPDTALRLAPGTCTAIVNTCNKDGHWPGGGDALNLARGVPFSVLNASSANGYLRQLCASLSAPLALDTEVHWSLHVLPDGEVGQGNFLITTAPALTVAASAAPAAVHAGEPTQLVAAVTGGVPPYSYSWTPETLVSDPQAPDPKSVPTQTTEYSVRVGDSVGQVTTVTVVVTVAPKPCGDAIVDTVAGEQCDDGNLTDGDGCSSTCQLEACRLDNAACSMGIQCCSGICQASTGTCQPTP